MNILIIITIIVIVLLLLRIIIYIKKERYFEKNLKIGDMCIFYKNGEDMYHCKIIKIDGNIVKLERVSDHKIYETIIGNISSI